MKIHLKEDKDAVRYISGVNCNQSKWITAEDMWYKDTKGTCPFYEMCYKDNKGICPDC